MIFKTIISFLWLINTSNPTMKLLLFQNNLLLIHTTLNAQDGNLLVLIMIIVANRLYSIDYIFMISRIQAYMIMLHMKILDLMINLFFGGKIGENKKIFVRFFAQFPVKGEHFIPSFYNVVQCSFSLPNIHISELISVHCKQVFIHIYILSISPSLYRSRLL